MTAKRADPARDHDEVTEAGLESFPASDPPAYNMPARHRFAEEKVKPADPEGATSRNEEAAGRNEVGTEQDSVIRQAMARQNVRVGLGHAPPDRERSGASRPFPVWIGVVIAAVVILALVLFL